MSGFRVMHFRQQRHWQPGDERGSERVGKRLKPLSLLPPHPPPNVRICKRPRPHLVHQCHTCKASPPRQARLLNRDVLRHHHHLDLAPLRLGLLSSQAKVQAVTFDNAGGKQRE